MANRLRLGVHQDQILRLKATGGGGARSLPRHLATEDDLNALVTQDHSDIHVIEDGTDRVEPLESATSMSDELVQHDTKAETTENAKESISAPPDKSQVLGNHILYGNKSDDAALAGRNAKQYWSAIQQIRRGKYENNKLQKTVQAKLDHDNGWFSDNINSMAMNTASNALQKQALTAAGPQQSSVQAKSNADFVTKHAQKRREPLDMDVLEKGLGVVPGGIEPLSENDVEDHVRRFREFNMEAEVSAIRARLGALSKFNATHLASSPKS